MQQRAINPKPIQLLITQYQRISQEKKSIATKVFDVISDTTSKIYDSLKSSIVNTSENESTNKTLSRQEYCKNFLNIAKNVEPIHVVDFLIQLGTAADTIQKEQMESHFNHTSDFMEFMHGVRQNLLVIIFGSFNHDAFEAKPEYKDFAAAILNEQTLLKAQLNAKIADLKAQQKQGCINTIMKGWE